MDQASTASSRNTSSSISHTPYIQSSRNILPKSPMPAWVPAVSVATAMMIFLSVSFYMRHRKVVKKRQILMDYFYIIFQYGGLRRKRMVTALCNTNAISLRELGRSFMISFDNENSCPFYLEDTAFTKSHVSSLSQSKNNSKSRNKLKVPFRRVMSQMVDDSALGNSVQEMLMKFKAKKKSNSSHGNQLAPPRGMSLSSIHEDTHTYSQRSEYETSSRFKQRRNAYKFDSSDSQVASFHDFLGDPDDQSLSNVIVEHYLPRKVSSMKRQSCPNSSTDFNDDDAEEFQVLSPSSHNLRVFQFGANSSISFRQQSHNKSDTSRSHKKEPLILVHAASNDISSSQESDDAEDPCSNGVMVLRRVSTECTGQDCYYVSENPAPAYKRNKRASVSTVSYVPSGNMNDYYHHCLHSSNNSVNSKLEDDDFNMEDNKFSSGFSWKKNSAAKTDSQSQNPPGPSRSKRSRLSLGEIGISNFNFNQRIEEGSMHEQESDGSCSKLSKQASDERTKPHGAWKRLKNVFAGIRWSQSSGSKSKQMKSSTSEERTKVKSKRCNNSNSNRKWNKFIKSLTGFRSFPEAKNTSIISHGPKISKSLPLGLDERSITIEDFELHFGTSPQTLRNKKRFTTKDSFSKVDYSLDARRRAPPKTRSFPDDMTSFFQSDAKGSPRLLHLQSDPCGTSMYQNSSSGLRNKKRMNTCDDYLHAHSNVDFIHSPSRSNYLSFSPQDSNYKTYRFLSGSISPRTLSPVATKRFRRYNSLSPLPEKQSSSSPRKAKNVRWYSHSERNSISERGFLVSPGPRATSNGFLFPYENRTRGSSMTDLPLSNESPHGSCKDLNNSVLLNVKESNQTNTIWTTSKVPGCDFVTIELETSAPQPSPELTQIEIKHDSADEKEVDSSSLQKNTPLTDLKYPDNEQEPVLLESNKNTNNSSLDSVYFDAFSIPGSPLASLEQTPFGHAIGAGTGSVTNTTTSLTAPTSSSLLSLSCPFILDNMTNSNSHGSVTEVAAASFTIGTENDTSLPQSSSPNRAQPYYALPPTFSVLHRSVCGGNNMDSTTATTTTAPTTSLPSHVVDILPESIFCNNHYDKDDSSNNNCSEATPLNMYNNMSNTNNSVDNTQDDDDNDDDDDDHNEKTRLLIDSTPPCVHVVERQRLEHQNSSEGSLINLTRLPRFGRRASGTGVPRTPP